MTRRIVVEHAWFAQRNVGHRRPGDRCRAAGSTIASRGLELRHVDEKFEKKLALLRDTIKRYKNTLRALAR